MGRQALDDHLAGNDASRESDDADDSHITLRAALDSSRIDLTTTSLNLSSLRDAATTSGPTDLQTSFTETDPALWANLTRRMPYFKFGQMCLHKQNLNKTVVAWPDSVCCQQCWRWGRKSLRIFDSELLCEYCQFAERKCIKELANEKARALTTEQRIQIALVRLLSNESLEAIRRTGPAHPITLDSAGEEVDDEEESDGAAAGPSRTAGGAGDASGAGGSGGPSGATGSSGGIAGANDSIFN
jgi:hypothetical protein